MRPSQIRNLIAFFVSLVVLIWAIATAADYVIEYSWWKEVGQAGTWISMLWYSIAPAAAGALVAFIALLVAHSRGLHFAGSRPNSKLYSRLCRGRVRHRRDHLRLGLHRLLDGDALFRIAGNRAHRERLERSRVFAAPAVL